MKRRFTTMTLAAGLLVTSTLAGGCGTAQAVDCPFTDLTWEATPDDLFAAEGTEKESYASTYGGTTYTYDGSYMEKDGTLKYMYDENDTLMSVAFAYGSDDEDELHKLYNEIKEETVEKYGESDSQTDGEKTLGTNYGDVWELKEGHIILSLMLTDQVKALQIAYVNPEDELNK